MLNEFWSELHKKELEYETKRLNNLISDCVGMAQSAQQRLLLAETLMAILDHPVSCPEWSLEYIARETKAALMTEADVVVSSHEEFLHKRNQIQERRKEVLVFVEVL